MSYQLREVLLDLLLQLWQCPLLLLLSVVGESLVFCLVGSSIFINLLLATLWYIIPESYKKFYLHFWMEEFSIWAWRFIRVNRRSLRLHNPLEADPTWLQLLHLRQLLQVLLEGDGLWPRHLILREHIRQTRIRYLIIKVRLWIRPLPQKASQTGLGLGQLRILWSGLCNGFFGQNLLGKCYLDCVSKGRFCGVLRARWKLRVERIQIFIFSSIFARQINLQN